MGEIKNYGKSNRTKLLSLARKTKGTDYNLILLRFVQERFLYRLSLSAYRENFFLKGGALLFAYERFAARPTRDMDFLGDHISRDKEKFVKRRMSDIIGKYNDKFEMKLPNYSHTLLCNRIDVNEYSNMRDLNQKIREVFVDYIDEVEQIL